MGDGVTEDIERVREISFFWKWKLRVSLRMSEKREGVIGRCIWKKGESFIFYLHLYSSILKLIKKKTIRAFCFWAASSFFVFGV